MLQKLKDFPLPDMESHLPGAYSRLLLLHSARWLGSFLLAGPVGMGPFFFPPSSLPYAIRGLLGTLAISNRLKMGLCC